MVETTKAYWRRPCTGEMYILNNEVVVVRLL